MNTGLLALSFNERAERILERLTYRRAVDEREREAIFRLRYEGYVRDGGIEPDATGIFMDRWDDAPNVELIGVYLDERLAGTVRIHVSGPQDDIPASDAFGDVVAPYLQRGDRLVDATRFVIDYRHASFSPEMPFLVLRAVAMAAEYFNAFGLLATVRKEHAVVYRRVTGHRALCGPRTYPLLRKPIVCMIAETQDLAKIPYAKHPFLRSTTDERARLFGHDVAAYQDSAAFTQDRASLS